MTLYAGETITFKTSATQIDDAATVLLDTDVTSTEIIVVDVAGATIVASTPMVWDATDLEWRYSWTSTTDGSFTARLRLIGATFDTWEYQKVKIKANPTPFTVP